jgi:hypothetical protein
MSSSDEHATEQRQQSYLVFLLISLVFILLVVPVIENTPFANGLLRVGITAVLISAAVATRRRKEVLVLGLFVALAAAPVSWTTMFLDYPNLFLFSCVLEGVFFIAMAIVILITVMQRHLATVHSIFGAISAYLLLGLAWAVVYWGVDHVDNGALELSNRRVSAVVSGETMTEVAEFSQFVYFSFVTMSTLGYGEITPRGPVAQTLAWMQSVTGQFYIAVLVAWMVSEIPKPPVKRPET